MYSDFYNEPFNSIDKEKMSIFVLKVNLMNEELKR